MSLRTPAGRALRRLLPLGLALLGACDAGPLDFDRPTAVAPAPDGSFFVADGYGNCRVLHFSARGSLIHQWGTCGSGPGELDTPHSVALARTGEVVIADRGNGRLQFFAQDGTFLRQLATDLGRPYGVALDGTGALFVVDGGDQLAGQERNAVMRLSPAGELLQRWGGHGDGPGQTRMAHAIAVHPSGSIFVADTDGKRVLKYRPRSP